MLDQNYDFIQSVIKNMPGWTINDVLDSDRDILMKLLATDSKKKKAKEEVVPLHEFIKQV